MHDTRRRSCGALTLLLALAVAFTIWAGDAKESRILGNWLTEPKDGIIQISVAAGTTYQGRIVGGSHPGRVDEKNPDPTQRSKPLRGQIILRDLRYDGDGKWSGGTIYEPDSGRTYKCLVELLAPDTLKVRGFIGISLLGKSQTWTRYAATAMDLPATR
ncbi:MAG TPA: DUF2147 domain-containing protein [Steroidobacteraceae bacterium]|jgi:uncharacterized protein (DUF2147 family)|nr:DUF2147 domain-containing protein [Steroidobacteraceae bacterium]